MTRISILVINPNSSQSITDLLKGLFPDPYPDPNISLSFFTAPPESPPSIDDEATSQLSTSVCLPLLIPLIQEHNAFLVACYSDHPLLDLLAEHSNGKPVLGIFEASVGYALDAIKSLPDNETAKFGIVTTGESWEKVLSDGVHKLFRVMEDEPVDQLHTKFAGVKSTSLSAIQLHTTPASEVHQRIKLATKDLVDQGARVICMGCAGMSGMEEAVMAGSRLANSGRATGREITVVDGVKAGIAILLRELRYST